MNPNILQRKINQVFNIKQINLTNIKEFTQMVFLDIELLHRNCLRVI